MTMTPDEKEEFLADHIPYKLGAIDLCHHVTMLLGRHRVHHETTIRLGAIELIQLPDMSVFTNAVVEHGFMSCRVMLEFLGIGLNATQDGLAEYRRHRSDTVTLKHFGLELLTVASVSGNLGGNAALLDGMVQAIRAGHKGGAHLTIGGERLQVGPLAAGCKATRSLVDHFLYRQLGRSVPPVRITVGDDDAT